MKKIIVRLIMAISMFTAWSYDYGIKFVEEKNQVEVVPENARIINERYVQFEYANSDGTTENRLKDMVSLNEVILVPGMYIHNFEVIGETPVLVNEKYMSFYLKPDLTDYHLGNMKAYNKSDYYDGGALVTFSGHNTPSLIDLHGNIVRNDIVTSKSFFSEGLVYCTFEDGSSGFMDSKGDVKIYVPSKYKNSNDVVDYYFKEGFAILHHNFKEYAIINKEGEIVYETEKLLETCFSDGYLGFKEVNENNQAFYGYMDKNFDVVVPASNPTKLGYGIPTYQKWQELQKEEAEKKEKISPTPNKKNKLLDLKKYFHK